MARQQQSRGKCNFCRETFSKRGINRHLDTCEKRKATFREGEQSFFHLHIFGTYNPFYWLNIELPADATLQNLDQFLRNIWLECCGHLSAFRINGVNYFVTAAGEMGGRSMKYELNRVLSPGMEFTHEYDFGTTTDLTLRVVGERTGTLTGKRKSDHIHILARNNWPEIPCDKCKERPARHICVYCVYEGGGYLCDQCAAEHECGEEALLPVVNSPRAGECGYTGPSNPSYL